MTRDEIIAWVRYRVGCPMSEAYDTAVGDAFRRAAGVPRRPTPTEPERGGSRFWERMMRQRIGALDRGDR